MLLQTLHVDASMASFDLVLLLRPQQHPGIMSMFVRLYKSYTRIQLQTSAPLLRILDSKTRFEVQDHIIETS